MKKILHDIIPMWWFLSKEITIWCYVMWLGYNFMYRCCCWCWCCLLLLSGSRILLSLLVHLLLLLWWKLSVLMLIHQKPRLVLVSVSVLVSYCKNSFQKDSMLVLPLMNDAAAEADWLIFSSWELGVGIGIGIGTLLLPLTLTLTLTYCMLLQYQHQHN